VVLLAPRVLGEIVAPRRLSKLVVRPLNFSVRRRPVHSAWGLGSVLAQVASLAAAKLKGDGVAP